MVNQDRMVQQLELHEGVKLTAYLDTLENWTIGSGYNLSARGVDALEDTLERRLTVHADDRPFRSIKLTRAESRKQLITDIDRIERATCLAWPYYIGLDEVRQRVALDMAFNIGFRALAFVKTIAAVERRDWTTAVRELYKSRWAYQVDDGPGKKFGRADRLGQMLLTGNDYTK